MSLRQAVQRFSCNELLSHLSLERRARDRCFVMASILWKPSRGVNSNRPICPLLGAHSKPCPPLAVIGQAGQVSSLMYQLPPPVFGLYFGDDSGSKVAGSVSFAGGHGAAFSTLRRGPLAQPRQGDADVGHRGRECLPPAALAEDRRQASLSALWLRDLLLLPSDGGPAALAL